MEPTSEKLEEEKPKSRKSTQRSPSYPYISLPKALERVKSLSDKEGRHPVQLRIAVRHWGFAESSSGGVQTAATLIQFGLIISEGGAGMVRLIRLSDRAWRLMHEFRPDEQRKLLLETALLPKLYGELWELWGEVLPSTENMRSYLILQKGFNPGAVDNFIHCFRETLEHAGLLGKPDGVDTENEISPEFTPAESERVQGKNTSASESKFHTATKVADSFKGSEEHLRVKLAGGRTARILFDGPPPTQKEVDKLIALLQLSRDQYPVDDTE